MIRSCVYMWENEKPLQSLHQRICFNSFTGVSKSLCIVNDNIGSNNNSTTQRTIVSIFMNEPFINTILQLIKNQDPREKRKNRRTGLVCWRFSSFWNKNSQKIVSIGLPWWKVCPQLNALMGCCCSGGLLLVSSTATNRICRNQSHEVVPLLLLLVLSLLLLLLLLFVSPPWHHMSSKHKEQVGGSESISFSSTSASNHVGGLWVMSSVHWVTNRNLLVIWSSDNVLLNVENDPFDPPIPLNRERQRKTDEFSVHTHVNNQCNPITTPTTHHHPPPNTSTQQHLAYLNHQNFWVPLHPAASLFFSHLLQTHSTP